jgi:predicted TIM-barrel fold metal-dependent hydrolase
MPRSLMDIDGMVEEKAGLGISATIVGSPVGAGTMMRVPGLDNYAQPLDALNEFHEWISEQVRARPRRLRAYAYVNPLGGDAMLAAASARLEQEEFVGLIANSSISGEYLDAPEADEFFAMAHSHRVPVLLHPPAEPAGGGRLWDPRVVEQAARPCDVAVGVAAIVFAGWLEKYPDLTIIAPIAGGGLSLLVEKLETAAQRPPVRGPAATSDSGPAITGRPSDSLARVYVDTATPSTAAIADALRVFGERNVLFGTDSPPLTEPLRHSLERLDALGLSPAGRELVCGGNAARIFGLEDDMTGEGMAGSAAAAGAATGDERR